MSEKALGIITPAANYIHVDGLQDFRPIGAFSFLGRFRVIDFPISNMSNSGIDRIQIYVGGQPRSIVEHVGRGRQYNINSKRGKVQLLFNHKNDSTSIYNNDIAYFYENLQLLERAHQDYVIIAPSYMVYKQDFNKMIDEHIESGADISLLCHKVNNAKEAYRNCCIINVDKDKKFAGIGFNMGNAKEKTIFMDTYCMKRELFIKLIKDARSISSAYYLANIVHAKRDELNIRIASHKGYFAALTSFNDYFKASMAILDIDIDVAEGVFNDPAWPFYTMTTDACPTKYLDNSKVCNSLISNGCIIGGTVENCIIGRNVTIEEGAVVKNSVISAYSTIKAGVRVENTVVDKWAKLIHTEYIAGTPDKPAYIKRNDTI